MGVQVLTRLLAVAISAFRMSGSYLEDEEDLELTAGRTRSCLEAEVKHCASNNNNNKNVQ